MEWKLSELDIAGYRGQQVPNTLIAQPVLTRHLGIVLPGYRYPVDMPPLHYAGSILLKAGADLLRVEYAYPRTDFLKQPVSEQERWFSSDVFAACQAGLSQRSYETITLVGKSLGTLAMGHLLADVRFQGATCIWLTPLLTVEWLCARIEQFHPRSLFVTGTADKFYKPDLLTQLVRNTGGRSLILPGVDHSLEVKGDISGSLRVLDQTVQAIQEFLKE